MTRPGDDSPFGLSLMRQPGDDPRRRLRPAPLSSLFEIGFRILRRHWAVLLGLSFLLGLPAALLDAAASAPLGQTMLRLLPADGATGPITISEAQARELGDGLLLTAAGTLVAGVLAAVAAVGFAWVVSQDYHGRRVGFADVLHHALTRAVAALLTAVLTALTISAIVAAGTIGVIAMIGLLAPDGPGSGGLGVFLAIVVGVAAALAVVVVNVRWTLAIPIVAVEGAGPIEALRRSWHLTGDATWRTFFALLLIGFVTMILGALVAQLLAIVIVDLVMAPMGLELAGETIVSALVALLFAPVTVVVMTAYLFDQKVRRDRWDLPEPA